MEYTELNLHKRKGDLLLKSYEEGGVNIEDILQKSGEGRLIPKQVEVKRANGKTYKATRWVSSETGEAQKISHAKYHSEHSIPGTTIEEKIQGIINDTGLNANDKARKLASLGLYDRHQLQDLTDHKYPADIGSILKKEAGIDTKLFDADNPNADLPVTREGGADLNDPNVQSECISDIQERLGSKEAFEAQARLRSGLMQKYGITIDDKWNSYESRLNRLVKDGYPKAVMAYGTGGIGKTYTWEGIAQGNKLIEYDPELDMEKNGDEYDYVMVSGKIGSRELQRKMYEHSKKILVFDDCDSMWNDEGLINVLKATLDSSGSGKCQWAQKLAETSKGAEDDVPASFKFEGRMVFITNLTKKELNERGASPIAESRASSIDLTMNKEQTLERLDKILPFIRIKNYKGELIPITDEDKQEAITALKGISNYARIEQLNTRTFGKILGEARSQRLSGNGYDQRKLAIFALQEFGIV